MTPGVNTHSPVHTSAHHNPNHTYHTVWPMHSLPTPRPGGTLGTGAMSYTELNSVNLAWHKVEIQ